MAVSSSLHNFDLTPFSPVLRRSRPNLAQEETPKSARLSMGHFETTRRAVELWLAVPIHANSLDHKSKAYQVLGIAFLKRLRFDCFA